jgi:hypothetical protein
MAAHHHFMSSTPMAIETRPVPTITEARATFEHSMRNVPAEKAAKLRNYLLAVTRPTGPTGPTI